MQSVPSKERGSDNRRKAEGIASPTPTIAPTMGTRVINVKFSIILFDPTASPIVICGPLCIIGIEPGVWGGAARS
jgi:hypothetical protein